MILDKELPAYLEEIKELYQRYLGEPFEEGGVVFAIVKDGVLQAVSYAQCYEGHWYLRSCVVKPEFRGRGLQRKLIRERLDHLADKTDVVRVSVFPGNTHSIANILAEGFSFERKKPVWNGVVDVYTRSLR